MTVFDTPYEQSYPPSLWGGGPGASVWGSTSGDISATFATVTGVDPATIADRTTLQADATVGTAAMTAAYASDPFPVNAYVVLGDGDDVSWNGTAWEDGPLPAPAPPPTPGESSTKAEIVAWLLYNGVTLTESALMALTKDELLELVENLLDGEVDP